MKFNVVLSGGGVRGYAHVGVLQALLEDGLEIEAVSGGSSGALIGAFLCDGYSPEEISSIILNEAPKVGVNFKKPGSALLSFSEVEKVMVKHLRAKIFEELKKPLFISATSLKTGLQHVFSSGPLLPPLAASSALPLLLQPVEIEGEPYADAGMSNNLPVEPFIGRPGKILGIHVNPILPYRPKSGIVETLDRAVHIIVGNTIRSSVSMCDVFIEPPSLVNYHILERKKAKEIIQAGYDHVKQILPEIREKMKQASWRK